MKTFLAIFLTLFLLVSCTTSLDTKAFNQQIEKRTDIDSPKELNKLYYGPYEVEGNSKLTITTKTSDDHKFEITLIHNGIGDDSVSDIRIVMTAKRNKQTWTVLSIQESWKCHEGRGHSYWAATKCS